MDAIQRTDEKPRHGRGSGWLAWVGVIVSLPLVLLGLWVGYQGEQVYRFLVEFPGEWPTASMWWVVEACRIVAWALLPLSALQVVLAIRVIMRARRPGSSGVVGLWVGLVIMAGLIGFWIVQMMPTVALMDAVASGR